MLGAFVGTDDYVLNALKDKMKRIQKLTDVLLQYPKAQAKYIYIDFAMTLRLTIG